MREKYNIIQPCLRSIFLVDGKVKGLLVLPKDWDLSLITDLIEEEIFLSDKYSGLLISIEINGGEEVYDTFEAIITILFTLVSRNQVELRKKALIEAKTKALSQLSYDELTNLSPEKLKSLGESEEVLIFDYVQEIEDLVNEKGIGVLHFNNTPINTPFVQHNNSNSSSNYEITTNIPESEGMTYISMDKIEDQYKVFDNNELNSRRDRDGEILSNEDLEAERKMVEAMERLKGNK